MKIQRLTSGDIKMRYDIVFVNTKTQKWLKTRLTTDDLSKANKHVMAKNKEIAMDKDSTFKDFTCVIFDNEIGQFIKVVKHRVAA